MGFQLKDNELPDYVKEIPPYEKKIIEKFTSDGCSGGMSWGWRKLFKKAPPWEGCCIKHDIAYWYGGTWQDRRKADIKLMRCVLDNGHPVWAVLMYVSVRIGGSPLWPFSWRWGYGWPWSGRYSKVPTEYLEDDF